MNNNFNLKQFLAEGKLLKEDTQSTLKRNQAYITKYTLLKDPNIGQDVVITSPYTVDKIIQAVTPLLKKEGVYDENEDPGIFQSILKEFKGWLQNNISNYDILQKEKLTAREIFDQIFYDFEFEVNELEEEQEDTQSTLKGNHLYNNFFQEHLKQELFYKHPESTKDIAIINSYKGKNITSLDELVKNIIDLEDELTEEAGQYPGDYYGELRERLEDLFYEINFPQSEELLNMLDKHYEEEED
jgi:hypothetical protein